MAPLALLGLAGLNIGMGALKAKQQAKQRQQEAEMRAAEIEAAPWTGRAASTQVGTGAPSAWAEMAGGAINSLGQAQSLEKSGLFSDAAQTGAPVNGRMAGALSPGNLQDEFAQSPTLMGKSPWVPLSEQKLSYLK